MVLIDVLEAFVWNDPSLISNLHATRLLWRENHSGCE
jgi:hypothetical protein